jgi:hypothetical protein
MSEVDVRTRKQALSENLRLLEAELNGALEVVTEDSRPVGEMLTAPDENGMMKTIRDLEQGIERLRQEYASLG